VAVLPAAVAAAWLPTDIRSQLATFLQLMSWTGLTFGINAGNYMIRMEEKWLEAVCLTILKDKGFIQARNGMI